jgi:hypothetical protein
MAKRQIQSGNQQPAGVELLRTAEDRLEGFAEDLGKLLGSARARAEGWLGQREKIASQLAEIRDTASTLLQQMTGGAAAMAAAVRGRRRGRPPGSTNRAQAGTPGRKGTRRRKMSAEARKRISDAQKKRWAKQKAATK